MTFKQVRKYGALLPVVVGGAAHAALPSNATTAITEAGTDLTTAAAAVLTAMIAFWAIKKVGTKMGWW